MRLFQSALLAILVIGLPGIGQARTEILRWSDPNPAPSPVKSFQAHHGPSSRNYDTVVDLGLPNADGSGVRTANITVPDDAVIFVALTASDPPTVSGFSNEQQRLPANQPPESTIDDPSGPVTILTGQSILFAGSGTDPDGDLPLTYSWDFQEAQSGVPPSTSQNPGSVTFSQVGTFTVTFTVTDSTGKSDPTPASVGVTVVLNQPPESTIDDPSGPVTISAGQPVVFAGSGTDPDLPLTYSWDFREAQSGVPPSTLRNPGSTTFSQTGSFTVTFTVTDRLGLPDPTPDTVVITVVNPGQPPESSIDAPTGPVTIDSGESVDFAGSGTDPDGDLPLTYHWDFQEAQSGVPPSTSQIPGSRTFSQSVTVTFTVTDSTGTPDPTPATVGITVRGSAVPSSSSGSSCGCGVGFELVFAITPLAWLRRRLRRAREGRQTRSRE